MNPGGSGRPSEVHQGLDRRQVPDARQEQEDGKEQEDQDDEEKEQERGSEEREVPWRDGDRAPTTGGTVGEGREAATGADPQRGG